ncbi:MAG: hypothetical protein HUJ29_06570 [Gammaproteobacteria bacterium]|nr:hypothetical protein [Gammaproteobacteria bacterium]
MVIDKPEHCELCGRQMEALTRHHLIPRMRHRNRRTQRQFDRDERTSRILWVCRPCHNHIHAVFSEKELAAQYNTRERLSAHHEIARFINWIANKPPGFKPQSRRMKRE